MEPHEKETCNIKKCKISTQPWFAEMYKVHSYSGDWVVLATFIGIIGSRVVLIKSQCCCDSGTEEPKL